MFLNAAELAATQAKIGAINARAAKRGFTGRVEVTSTPTVIMVNGSQRHGFDVEITGEPPRYDGWTFIASVEAVDGKALVKLAPGAPNIAPDSVTPGECEHCRTNRYRRHTYLVMDDHGTIKQVGKTCLKDFLGWNTWPVFISEESAEEEVFRGLSGEGWYDFREVAALAFAAADRWGYRSVRSDAATRDTVSICLNHGKGWRELMDEMTLPTSEELDARLAEVRSNLDRNDNFGGNLLTLMDTEVVSPRNMGLAVAVAATRKKVEKRPASTHRGTVGERIEFTGTVERVRAIDSQFGTSLLVIVNADNDIIKMFTTARWACGAKEGDTVALKGTVKAHEEYGGRHETVVTRAKAI